jgi:hypothetical protein
MPELSGFKLNLSVKTSLLQLNTLIQTIVNKSIIARTTHTHAPE